MTTGGITLPLVLALVAAVLVVLAPLPAGVLEFAGFCPLAAWLASAEFPAEPAGDGCCAPCGEGTDWAGATAVELSGAAVELGADELDAGALGVDEFGPGEAAGAGGLGGADAAASSSAANGCEVVSWLDEDACIHDGGSEIAAGESGAILDILDTWNP